jgi:hypothetical protein
MGMVFKKKQKRKKKKLQIKKQDMSKEEASVKGRSAMHRCRAFKDKGGLKNLGARLLSFHIFAHNFPTQ